MKLITVINIVNGIDLRALSPHSKEGRSHVHMSLQGDHGIRCTAVRPKRLRNAAGAGVPLRN
jgi:hypothetical protein